jgi:hypothetical protein
MPVWSLPKLFHSCGKNCGKSTGSADIGEFNQKAQPFLGICLCRAGLNTASRLPPILWRDRGGILMS